MGPAFLFSTFSHVCFPKLNWFQLWKILPVPLSNIQTLYFILCNFYFKQAECFSNISGLSETVIYLQYTALRF